MSSGAGGDAMETDGEATWTTAGRREKRKQHVLDDSMAHVVYITGSNEVITKINPLKLREKLVNKIGAVKTIYISGNSLKVYSKHGEQKINLLRSTSIDYINISCSEPVIGFKSGGAISDSPKPINMWRYKRCLERNNGGRDH